MRSALLVASCDVDSCGDQRDRMSERCWEKKKPVVLPPDMHRRRCQELKLRLATAADIPADLAAEALGLTNYMLGYAYDTISAREDESPSKTSTRGLPPEVRRRVNRNYAEDLECYKARKKEREDLKDVFAEAARRVREAAKAGERSEE